MFLAFSEADLDAYIGTANNYDDSDADENEDDSEDDSDGSEEGYLGPTVASKKRKAPKAVPKRGRGRPKKLRKVDTIRSNRLHLRFRGRETGEGSVFYTPQQGHLGFTDSDFVAFKGVASMPAVGDKVPFEGFKVSSEASTQAEPWSAFSERVYEEERVSRWH